MISPKQFIIQPGGKIEGEVTVPGDKSISHRAIIISAIAEGTTQITGFLPSLDCIATINAFRSMGVKITASAESNLTVQGVGMQGLTKTNSAINLGNAGTAARLLTGLLAGQVFSSLLIGDASLSQRPMARIVNPLRQMGAEIKMHNDNFLPLQIIGGQQLHAIHYEMPVASAQVKSGILLAGLYVHGGVAITEPIATRDHTEKLLTTFGCKIARTENKIILHKPERLIATNITIPADISSAAFFMVGALITPGSSIILKNVGINPTRIGVITLLKMMGAKINLINQRMLGVEPVADISITHSKLHGINIPQKFVSLAIDEFPALFVAAACAEGITYLSSASELRIKESDRIKVMAGGLQTIGINVEVIGDGIKIEGGKIKGGEVNSYGDHRIAMAFSIAGLIAQDEIKVNDCENVATSFPGFVKFAQQLGLNITAI